MRLKSLHLFAMISAIVILGFLNYGVKVSATIPTGSVVQTCPIEAPIYVKINNFTFGKVKKVEFTLELYKNNISRNMLKDSHYVFEGVIDSFSTAYSCYTDNYIKNLNKPTVNKNSSENDRVRGQIEGGTRPKLNLQQLIKSHQIHLYDINILYVDGQVEYQKLDYTIENMRFFTSQGKIPNGCFGQLQTDLNGDNSVAAILL